LRYKTRKSKNFPGYVAWSYIKPSLKFYIHQRSRDKMASVVFESFVHLWINLALNFNIFSLDCFSLFDAKGNISFGWITWRRKKKSNTWSYVYILWMNTRSLLSSVNVCFNRHRYKMKDNILDLKRIIAIFFLHLAFCVDIYLRKSSVFTWREISIHIYFIRYASIS